MMNETFLECKYFLIFQSETDDMYARIEELQTNTREANSDSDRFDADIRDTGKRVQKLETNLEEVMEKMMQSAAKMDEAEKEFKDKDDDVNAQSRRVLLLEEECRISVEKLATTVHKLATMSKDADQIIKGCRHWESNTMNNEVEIETTDNNLREARKMGKSKFECICNIYGRKVFSRYNLLPYL